MRTNLKNERTRNGYRRAEVADLVKISTRQYARLETGVSNGSVQVWQRLSDLFNKEINYLLEQEVENSNSMNKL